MRITSVAIAFALASCSTSGVPDRDAGGDAQTTRTDASARLAEACDGTQPTLESCANGLVHSECGGDGAAVLACHEITGSCRWFDGGCVALGFRPIDCPSDDICCVPTTDGAWPFEGEWVPSSDWGDRELVEDIAFAGPAPVTRRSPATVAVTIDPTVAASDPVAHCDGGLELGFCHEAAVWVGRAPRRHDSFVLVFRPSLFGEELYVEVVEQEDGALVGRTFSRYLNDYYEAAPRSCAAARTRNLALSGSLVLDRLAPDPVDAHGVLDVADPSGGTLRLVF